MSRLARRIKERLGLGMLDPAIIQGDGYEALITREGIVVGRVYLGTIEEVESLAR